MTQMGNEALWEAAAHTNRLQHNLLQEMLGQSFFRMTCGHLGDDFGHGLEHFAR